MGRRLTRWLGALARPGGQPRRTPNRSRAAEGAARVQAVRDHYAALRQRYQAVLEGWAKPDAKPPTR